MRRPGRYGGAGPGPKTGANGASCANPGRNPYPRAYSNANTNAKTDTDARANAYPNTSADKHQRGGIVGRARGECHTLR